MTAEGSQDQEGGPTHMVSYRSQHLVGGPGEWHLLALGTDEADPGPGDETDPAPGDGHSLPAPPDATRTDLAAWVGGVLGYPVTLSPHSPATGPGRPRAGRRAADRFYVKSSKPRKLR